MTEKSNEKQSTPLVKRGLAEMLKGGVIMDVVTADQAKIAEDAGAVAVMALERVPADIRAQGGVARMSDPDLIDQIISTSMSQKFYLQQIMSTTLISGSLMFHSCVELPT